MNVRKLHIWILFITIACWSLSISANATNRPLRTVWVKVVADQTFAAQPDWEKQARDALNMTAEHLANVLGIKLEILSYDYWPHKENMAMDSMTSLMINEVDPGQADILIGFTLLPGDMFLARTSVEGVTIPYRGMIIKMYNDSPQHEMILPFIIVHEMTHVFGGVHVDGGGLMAPHFKNQVAMELDNINRGIVRLTREVDFSAGHDGLDEDDRRQLARLYEMAVSRGNNEISVLLELGRLYRGLNENTRAAEKFKAVTKIEPHLAYAWIMLGECFYREGQPLATIKVLEEALDNASEKDLIYGKLAGLYYNEGMYDKSYYYAKMARNYGAEIDSSLWQALEQRLKE